MFLSDAELAMMRADVAGMLPDTCTLEVFGATTRDATGAYTEGWTTVASNVPCRLDPIPQRSVTGMELAAAKEVVQSLFQLTVPYNTAITVDQRVVIDSVAYQIKTLHAVHSWNVDKRATVTRID